MKKTEEVGIDFYALVYIRYEVAKSINFFYASKTNNRASCPDKTKS